METIIIRGQQLKHYKDNAEENYITTPISVLKYITVLEEVIEHLQSEIEKL
jgi:hypothetical protein